MTVLGGHLRHNKNSRHLATYLVDLTMSSNLASNCIYYMKKTSLQSYLTNLYRYVCLQKETQKEGGLSPGFYNNAQLYQ